MKIQHALLWTNSSESRSSSDGAGLEGPRRLGAMLTATDGTVVAFHADTRWERPETAV
jgi:hypothetical protein